MVWTIYVSKGRRYWVWAAVCQTNGLVGLSLFPRKSEGGAIRAAERFADKKSAKYRSQEPRLVRYVSVDDR